MTDRDALKREAAEQASQLVEDGMVVGLGTGTTATYFIEALIRRAKAGLQIACIPTSERSAEQARDGGLSLTSFRTHRAIDVTVDGADEIKRDTLDLVKGLGGALLREKIVASASRKVVIVADEIKLVDWLGSTQPVPVEVTRFGWELTSDRLAALGAEVTRRTLPDGENFLTDGGNFILDCRFPPLGDAASTARSIRAITGVVESGIFLRMAHLALVAGAHGVARYAPA